MKEFKFMINEKIIEILQLLILKIHLLSTYADIYIHIYVRCYFLTGYSSLVLHVAEVSGVSHFLPEPFTLERFNADQCFVGASCDQVNISSKQRVSTLPVDC